MGRFLDIAYKQEELERFVSDIFNNNSEVKAHKIGLSIFDCQEGLRVFFKNEAGEDMCQFSFEAFPGNWTVAVSTGTYVHEKYRNIGIGKVLQKVKEALCRKLDIQMLLATVNKTNEVEQHILANNGWRVVGETKVVGLYKKNL